MFLLRNYIKFIILYSRALPTFLDSKYFSQEFYAYL